MAMRDAWAAESWPARYQAIGALLVSPSLLHVALTAMQVPRVGWFWLVIPLMAMAVGVLLLGASVSAQRRTSRRSSRRPHLDFSTAAPVKVLALSPIPEEGAGCRFRVSQYIPYLRDAGFDVTVSPFYSREYFSFVYRPGNYLRKAIGFVSLTLRRISELFSIRKYDLVFLYREAIPIGPPLIERWIVAPASRSSMTSTTRSSCRR